MIPTRPMEASDVKESLRLLFSLHASYVSLAITKLIPYKEEERETHVEIYQKLGKNANEIGKLLSNITENEISSLLQLTINGLFDTIDPHQPQRGTPLTNNGLSEAIFKLMDHLDKISKNRTYIMDLYVLGTLYCEKIEKLIASTNDANIGIYVEEYEEFFKLILRLVDLLYTTII